MTRRAFLPAAAASTLAAGNAAAADTAKNVILELRRIQLRNSADNQRQRNNDFLKQQVAALQRAGAGPVGVFASNIAPDGPFLLVLVELSVARRDGAGQAKLAADAEYQKALDAYNAQPGLNYERMESSLLRAFDGYPNVVPPPNDGKRPARLFEVRTVRIQQHRHAAQKGARCSTMAKSAHSSAPAGSPSSSAKPSSAPNQPNLTYMLSYEDLAGRDKVWKAFGADPEWQKLRTTPGLSRCRDRFQHHATTW